MADAQSARYNQMSMGWLASRLGG